MSLSWTFTGIEFQVLCEKYRGGEMPDPLFWTLDEHMTIDKSAALKADVWQELRAKWDPSWDSMIDVMCAPEIYIRLHGWDERDMDNGKKNIYIHFARSGAQAFKFEQKPGKTYWHTDGYIVTECDPRSLASEVVRSLPPTEAGSLSSTPIIIDPAEHVGHGGGSFFKDDDEDPPAVASTKFFNMPASKTGTLRVVQGRSKFGPRGIQETKLLWRDVIGDGRYVMNMDDSPVAVGIGRNAFANKIQQQIDNLMERLDTHWESGRPEDRW
ncbi:ESX secretion-associated protein EspG [Nocardia jiangxiensis]|uniref:ESX secretion-associated protein EspG n=1 Tax=Nocardia jiangxiensis TaxID=282685 RepID=A0ABW6RRR9_9NOCA|nr:ESX secretion-associated protein EspG [Nocardia jiangxiensis]